MASEEKHSRRQFVASLAGGSFAAMAAVGLPAAEAEAEGLTLDGATADDAVRHYWNRPLSEIVDIGVYKATPAEMERHRVYANLVLALLHGYFNGNKEGDIGEYPWQPSQRVAGSSTQSLYAGGRYLGHNICCIAVDGDGDIIDFDFNHNSIFNSSVEHAEARLIKRIFSLSDIHQDWDSSVGVDNRWNLTAADERAPMRGEMDDDYGRSLSNVTIYTSLESCAQCSGIMTLANIKEVVYLQPDPTQYMIGKIMYRLSRPVGVQSSTGAPRPISGSEVGMEVTELLAKGYSSFKARVGTGAGKVPFYKPPGSDSEPAKWSGSKSITSFLCTDIAFSLFKSGRDILDTMELSHSDFRPDGQGMLSNAEVLTQARHFLNYALTEGRRGTPHR